MIDSEGWDLITEALARVQAENARAGSSLFPGSAGEFAARLRAEVDGRVRRLDECESVSRAMTRAGLTHERLEWSWKETVAYIRDSLAEDGWTRKEEE